MLALIAVLFLAYVYVLPRWSDWSQNSRLNLVLAVADDGTVKIDRYVANTGDYALFNGHAYTDKAPGPAFLALPVYMALRPVIDHPLVVARSQALGAGDAMAGTLRTDGTGLRNDKLRYALVQYSMTALVIALPAALFGALFFLALRWVGASPTLAALGTLAYGLATAAAPYAGNFYSHQLVATLIFGALMVVWRGGSTPKYGTICALLAGLLLGWAIISEYPAALAALIIGVYALWRRGWRWALPMALGGFIPGCLLMAYNMAAFNTIWPVGYAHSALWQEQHQTGFMSLTYPQPAALWGLLFSDFRGLFVRAPWLLLALPGYVAWWRSQRLRAEWWVALLIPVAFLLFYGSSAMWWGGFAAGPRYIVPMIPFLALPAIWWLATAAQQQWQRLLAFLLVSLSLLLTWMEAVAGQLFPTDAQRATWTEVVLPAWANGDIARNLGMALGLDGGWSLLPLLVLLGGAVALVGLPTMRRRPTLAHNEQLATGD
jgi:hypothetical protein